MTTQCSRNFSNVGRDRPLRGFTLIELIGVMAVMAILASVITPNIIDDVLRARQQREAQILRNFSAHLISYVQDEKRLPTLRDADWTRSIAMYSNDPEHKILFNEQGYRRGYYVDPRFFTDSDEVFNGYIQTGGLSREPNSPRIMLVSSLTSDAPPAPTSGAAFDAIWHQRQAASLSEGPGIKIERINLRKMFHRVILSNEHAKWPKFQLETGELIDLPSAQTYGDGLLTRYVIDKTRLNLFADSHEPDALDEVIIVEQAQSYSYRRDGDVWRWRKP